SNAPPVSSEPVAANPHVDSTGGMTPTRTAAPPRRRSFILPLIAAVLVALGARSLAFRAREKAHATIEPQAIPEPSASVSVPLAPIAPPLPPARTVSLAIVPPFASVEIDGVATRTQGGSVTISGPLGSTHRVRVSYAKKETVVHVAVAESG